MAIVQHIILVLLLPFACLKSFDKQQSLLSMINTNGSHSCPQPTVGNCSCKWIEPYVNVTCVGLETVPEKLPENTIYITFFNGTIKEIPQMFFLSFKNLISLDLQCNNISNKFYLPKSLINLYLNHNHLNASTIFGMFDNLTRLRNLELSYNPLGKKLVSGTFSSIKNVKQLILYACSLEDVGENMFFGLTNLRELNLAGNKIRTLKKGVFRGVSSPKEERSLVLRLFSNQISHVEGSIFEGVYGISDVILSGNQLSSIPNLTGLSNLQHLNFIGNSIVDISLLSQSGITRINILKLNDNQISVIPADVFKYILIGTLDLTNNKIKQIPPRFLEHPKRPQITNNLLLGNNKLEFVDSESFAGLPNMRILYLFNNAIRHLPDGVFSNLSFYDQYIFLNKNKFKNLTGRPFKGMKNTKASIFLFTNDIVHIDDNFVKDLGNEVTMNLDCKDLADLPRKTNGKIACTPYSLKEIKRLPLLVARSLVRSGFACKGPTAMDWSCSFCKPGTFGNSAIDSNRGCIECSAGGFYQDGIGATECKECSMGTYVHPNSTPGTTPLSCQACPQGTQTSEKAGYRACKCLPNFYRLDRFGRCFPCPSKAFKCENDYASLSAGFYWRWENSTFEKQYHTFIENLMIESPEFAEGTWKYLGTLPNPHKCPRESCLGGLNSSCQNGYQGPLCALCEQHYFNKNNRCIRCPSRLWAGLQVAIVIVLFVGVLLALLWGDRKKLEDRSGRTWADKILSCFKIVIGFYQVMAGLYSAFSNITWPSSVIWMQRALHFIQLNILQIAPLSCITPRLSFNVLQQFVIVIALNITVVTFILIYLMIRIAILKRKKSYSQNEIEESEATVAKTKSSCIRNICVFLFATYPRTCTSIIQVLSINCVQLCFDEEHAHCDSYLRMDLSVQCHTTEHNTLSWVATAFLVYPIGFPVVILILVWKYIHKPASEAHENNVQINMPAHENNVEINMPAHENNVEINMPAPENNEEINMPAHENNVEINMPAHENTVEINMPAVAATTPTESPFKSGLSLFSENYESNCWYWEGLEMIRKLVLISGLTLIGEHSRTQIGLGAIISAVFAILYVYKRPITNKFENLLQTVALMAIFLNLGIGVMLKASDNDKMSPVVNKHNDDLGVSIMMIIINVAVIGIVTVAVLKVVIMQILKCCKSTNEDNRSCGKHCCKACLRCCRSLLLPLKMGSDNFTHESRDELLHSAINA